MLIRACQSIVEDLSDCSPDRLLPYLRALAEFALSAPTAFEEQSEQIIRYVMQDVMLKTSSASEVSMHGQNQCFPN